MSAAHPSWKLAPDVAAATQALVATGFGRLPTGRALFLRLPSDCGGAWLKALRGVVPITVASDLAEKALPQAAAIAFTWTGLQRMGLAPNALASFSAPFREGMLEENRLRRLGDRRGDVWLDTVVEGGPRWSGNTPPRQAEKNVRAYSVDLSEGKPETGTAVTGGVVHALLLIYSRNDEEADATCAAAVAVLEEHHVRVVHTQPLLLDVEQRSGISREHFGFADGLSQPQPYDRNGHVLKDGAPATEPHPVQGVPLGEFLMGYENGHQEIAPAPVVPGDVAGTEDQRPIKAGLPRHPEARGFFDFGRNGSYLVVRELAQNVAAFWRAMDTAAALIRENEPEAREVTSDWVAERVVGRDREGHLIRPGNRRQLTRDARPDNDYLFFDEDRHGFGCPLGSHVRRAHPRDSLAPTQSTKATLLKAANNHRILRRGRKYGPNCADLRVDDGASRGLLFMCLNTDIARQFEFIQQTWLLNSDFHTMFEETDPLIGPDGWMTIPEDPLRRRIHVETFVQFSGGEYFFLPSIPALNYLGQL
ncbi:Dyp-type peroxidase [Acuticoccus yangtzensis]|uniref:Dyp-type peroxidase n=1 Tax=Acuticoccus yangtzensis TaxID=1443441 RepID=UPI0009496BFA|nr:hypothetical protein [Acuticoccus yangtzensis]